jgi:hypothetical protein
MAVFTPEFSVTLTNTWVKVLDANPVRRFLRLAPSTVLKDAFWSTNAALAGTTAVKGFPVGSGEDFGLVSGGVPREAIYMRSSGGEVMSIQEGA